MSPSSSRRPPALGGVRPASPWTRSCPHSPAPALPCTATLGDRGRAQQGGGVGQPPKPQHVLCGLFQKTSALHCCGPAGLCAAVWLGPQGLQLCSRVPGFHQKHFLGRGTGLRAPRLLPQRVPRSFSRETWLLCLRVYLGTPVLYRGAGLDPECWSSEWMKDRQLSWPVANYLQ